MDKLLLKLHSVHDYDACLKTLKATSYDKENKAYLCNNPIQVYDFDCFTEILYPPPNKKPRSFDALVILDLCLYCIEFKNQLPSKIDNAELQEKLEGGQETLKELFRKYNLQKKAYDFLFFVVYKKPKSMNDFDGYKNHFSATTSKFNLESQLKSYFKTNKVITHDVAFLSQKYSSLLNE